MKSIRLVLILAGALGGSSMNASAYGCGWGGWGFYIGIPFLSIGLNLGPGAGWGSPGYCQGYPSYTYYNYNYASAPPAAGTNLSANPAPASAEVASAAQPASQPPTWVPSSPGAGHWVPDATPYVYSPPASASHLAKAEPASLAIPATPSTSSTRSPGGVPVYVVSAR